MAIKIVKYMCGFCKFTRDTDFDKCPACSYEEKYVKVKDGFFQAFHKD